MILTGIFGDCKRTEILEILLENKEEELSVPEIEEMSEISRVTIYKYLEILLDDEIVEESRKVGKTQFYRLDFTNPVTKLLLALETLIIKQKLERKIIERESETTKTWESGETTIFAEPMEASYSIQTKQLKKETHIEESEILLV